MCAAFAALNVHALTFTVVPAGILGGTFTSGEAINASGTSYWWAKRRQRIPHAFHWDDNIMRTSEQSGKLQFGYAINDNGRVRR